MSDSTESHRNAEDPQCQLLRAAVLELLRTIPETWSEVNADSLTSLQQKGLTLLTAAGLVERRVTLRLALHNNPTAVEAVVTATGECGFANAIESVLAAMWGEWSESYGQWKRSELADAPSTICERVQPESWRLSDQGVIAVADVANGESQRALDFILWQGFFDGQPHLIAGRIGGRQPVIGEGRLVNLRKYPVEELQPSQVRIGNWHEGAEAFARAFGTFLSKNPPKVGEERRFSTASIRELTGLNNGAINKYAKEAGLLTPRKGQKNFTYSLSDARSLLNHILDRSTEDRLRSKCRKSLDNLDDVAK